MTPQNLLILVAFASSCICFSWTLFIVKRGKGFYTQSETDAKRLNLKLIRDLVIESLMLGGFILLLGNFLFFMFTNEWALDPTFDMLTLLMVFVFSLLYIIEHIYEFAKDKAEKPRRV